MAAPIPVATTYPLELWVLAVDFKAFAYSRGCAPNHATVEEVLIFSQVPNMRSSTPKTQNDLDKYSTWKPKNTPVGSACNETQIVLQIYWLVLNGACDATDSHVRHAVGHTLRSLVPVRRQSHLTFRCLWLLLLLLLRVLYSVPCSTEADR